MAFFIAGSYGFAGVTAGACGLRRLARLPAQGLLQFSPAPLSLDPSRVKNLKSASTEISLVTNQEITRGLFNRFDSVIA